MKDSSVAYTTDLLIFGIDSRVSNNLRALPKKYFEHINNVPEKNIAGIKAKI